MVVFIVECVLLCRTHTELASNKPAFPLSPTAQQAQWSSGVASACPGQRTCGRCARLRHAKPRVATHACSVHTARSTWFVAIALKSGVGRLRRPFTTSTMPVSHRRLSTDGRMKRWLEACAVLLLVLAADLLAHNQCATPSLLELPQNPL